MECEEKKKGRWTQISIKFDSTNKADLDLMKWFQMYAKMLGGYKQVVQRMRSFLTGAGN